MPTLPQRLVLAGTGLAVAGSLALGLAGPSIAGAAPASPTSTPAVPGAKAPATLESIKTAGAAAIAARETQLAKLAGRLSAAPNCDAAGTVSAEIAADGPALTTLGAKLAVDTDLATARADFRAIFEQYRVYLVVTPQASVTSACGHIQTSVAKLDADAVTLSAKVDEAANGGADMSAARASLQDLAAKLADGTNLANHANATLAGLTPDKGDKAVEASNAAAVSAARQDLTTAHADLTAAVKDAKAVVSDLKAVAPH